MKKILFYTSNGISLGHLQRSCQISKAIRIENRKAKIILITSSLKPSIFGKFFDHCVQTIPLSDKLVQEPFQEARLENTDVVLSAFEHFKPDLVVADFLLGSHFTFYPLKYALDNFPTKSIFIWRLGEIKNLADDLEKEKNKLGYFKKIILPYDKAELKNTLILKDSKFEISGPVFREIDKNKISFCREKYRISSKYFLITITLGGGGELKVGKCESPSKIVENFLKIYPQLKKLIPNLKVVISIGPYYNKKNMSKLNVFGEIKVVEFEENFLELIHLSNLVISPAGYNTCQEIIQAGTPAVLVPLWRKNKEQFERAQYLKKKGIVNVLQGNSPARFLKLITDSYNNLEEMKVNFKKFPELNAGNQDIAKIILNLC